MIGLTWAGGPAASLNPAKIISLNLRGKISSPVFDMKQWAADRIVSSLRMVPPHMPLELVYCAKNYINFLEKVPPI